jgi:hypothetical protein
MRSKITAYIDSKLKEALATTLTRGELSRSVEHALEDIAYGAEMEDILMVFDEKLEELPSGSQVKQLRPKAPGSSAAIIAAMRRARN